MLLEATVLLSHTGHNAEHLGPDDKKQEHSARSSVTSKTNCAQVEETSNASEPTIWHPRWGEGMPSPSTPTHRLDVEGIHEPSGPVRTEHVTD